MKSILKGVALIAIAFTTFSFIVDDGGKCNKKCGGTCSDKKTNTCCQWVTGTDQDPVLNVCLGVLTIPSD